MSSEARSSRASLRTVSALALVRGHFRTPWGVNWAPFLALRETSFMRRPALMPLPSSAGAAWSFSLKVR